MFLGASIGYIYGLEVGFTEGNDLCIPDGIVLGITFDTYYGTDLGLP